MTTTSRPFSGEKPIRSRAPERFLYAYPDTGRFRVAVSYPNSYSAGMSNLGFQSLYHRVASFRGVRAARFFIERGGGLFSPEFHDVRKRELFPQQNCTLGGFDAAFFSVSYELDYPGVLSMLKLSGVPLPSTRGGRPISPAGSGPGAGGSEGPAGRGGRGAPRPFVLIGGIAVSANPRPLSPFADALFVGEMDEALGEIMDALFSLEFRKGPELLERLAAVKGVYVSPRGGPLAAPGSGRTEVPSRAAPAVVNEPAHTVVLTKRTEFSDMFLVEIVRGCRNTCNFCMTRCVGGPARSVRKELVLERAAAAIRYTAKVGLIGPVLTDNLELPGIVEGVNALGGIVSFSSLRADHFDARIARLLQSNGQNSVTFAPESGSERLRERIGKGMEGEAVERAVAIALDHGVRRFRLYLMYGLPGETPEDLRLTVEMVRRVSASLEAARGAALHLSVNPFVPKRGTPFEGEGILPRGYYEDAKAWMRRELEGIERLTLRFESLRLLPLQHLLSVGGEDAGRVMGEAVAKGDMRLLEGFAERFAEGGPGSS